MIPLIMATASIARTSDADGTRLYSSVREKVSENSRKMTRYMCVETVDRSQFLAVGRDEGCGATTKRGRLAQKDRLRLDVTVVNGGESFSRAGARRFESRDVQKLVGNGATVTGEFSGFLLGAFSRPPDMLQFEGIRGAGMVQLRNPAGCEHVSLARRPAADRSDGGSRKLRGGPGI
jgi:hypothetical protein